MHTSISTSQSLAKAHVNELFITPQCYHSILHIYQFFHCGLIIITMSNQQEEKPEMQMDLEIDELDDMPGLFHKSSLRERTDPLLEPVAKETYELKKWYDPNSNEMYNQYQVVEELGRGAFGAVVKGKSAEGEFALKLCSIIGLEKHRFFAADGQFANSLDILYNELNILKRLKHKNIAQCFQIMYGNDRIISVNELGNLGQIMNWDELSMKYYRNPKVVSYISKKYGTSSIGDITRIVFLQVCEGVKYLHDNGITNRDIKVDNILCRQTSNLGDEVKVVDFTTVRYHLTDDISYFPTGTAGFRGPEHQFASSDGYSCKSTDVWGVGLSMYVFYYENLPFFGEDEFEMDCKAKNEELPFDEDCPAVVKDVIGKMTRKDWKERISIDQAIDILKHG